MVVKAYQFDFEKITIKEYRNLLSPSYPEEEGDEIAARVAGLTVADIEAMSYAEWRRFMRLFFEAARNAGTDQKN